VYDETDLMTSPGQSGSPVQLKVKNKKTGKEEWKTIGVHVGNDKGKNYATLISDNVFLDFIVPMIQDLTYEFGKPVACDTNKAKKYRKVVD